MKTSEMPVLFTRYRYDLTSIGMETPTLYAEEIVKVLPSGWRTKTGWLMSPLDQVFWHETPLAAIEDFRLDLETRAGVTQAKLDNLLRSIEAAKEIRANLRAYELKP